MDTRNLISYIIVKKNKDNEHHNLSFPLKESHHVYIAFIDEWEKHGKKLIRFDRKQKEKWEYCDHKAITTPWVLFLEENEYLSPAEHKKLLNYTRKYKSEVTELNIERLISPEILNNYSWVTTRRVFENPSKNIRRYFTSEKRLIPTDNLQDITLTRSTLDTTANHFILKWTQSSVDTAKSDISISRYSKYCPKETLMPKDSQIFKYGHQQYFDDKVFSARFIWPHTVYQTIRLDYIPSIFTAMKENLSTPQVVLFTLLYLLRFRNFSQATELTALIPEHWYKRDPDLLNIIATLHFINGNHEEALNLYQYALDFFSEFELTTRNATKIHILLERYEAIDEIIHQYRKASGKELKDDYYTEFKRIHKGIPKRTATLSLCLIIKDEEKTIERAILSAKPMADEIIVVDTGSTDYSSAIAEKLGAKVFQYDWCDDFSAARNFAISKATCDYIMMLDGDEYISPFFYLDCQALKKVLPLDEPQAINLSIGSYFNETDWLFLARETGNFRTETTSTRIFPRQSGIEYKGCIGETLEPSLDEKNVPIRVIPDSAIHILHDTEDRLERIERKYHIYRKVNHPDYSLILSAIRDFSLLGKMDETLQWLDNFYRNYSVLDQRKLTVGLRLAKLMEADKPALADDLYRQLINTFPKEISVMLAYADYLLRNNQLNIIQSISFNSDYIETELTQGDRIEYECFKSLKYFESGVYEKAFDTLSKVLEENAVHVFAQSLRCYYLICMNELEGAVATIDALFQIFDCREYFKINCIEDMLSVVEKICDQLLTHGYLKEGSLILEGASNLAQRWR